MVVSMAAMISTNLTKKQRIRNFSSPLRDNSTSMDCWSSGNPLLDEFATSQEDLPPCLLRLFRPPSPCFFRSQRTPCWSHADRPADVPVGLAVVRPMVPTGGGGPASYGLQFYNDWFIFMFQEVTFPLQWWDRLACPPTAPDARAA